MSYIVARVMEQDGDTEASYGFKLDEIDFDDRDKNDLDMNLDDEALPFILGLIDKISDLAEGEALVIWKEIF